MGVVPLEEASRALLLIDTDVEDNGQVVRGLAMVGGFAERCTVHSVSTGAGTTESGLT